MRTTIRLKDELLRRAKRKAAQEGRSLTSLIEEGLLAVMSESAGAGPKKARSLPISKRGGGLKPGVDINSGAAMADISDADSGWISPT